MHRLHPFSNHWILPSLAGLVAVMALASSACLAEEDVIGANDSFEDFAAGVYQEPDSGLYIVDGDIPVQGLDRLREFYERHVRPGALIVHQTAEIDAIWGVERQRALTYCVSKQGFGAAYTAVVQAMSSATGAWAAAADVHFVHLRDEDIDCDRRNGKVLFDVRPTNGGHYLARAFFPGDERRYRNILIDWSSFRTEPPLTLVGILRHELGHVLGFRHEHTRPESGVCFEDGSWRELTDYDPDSVMHYPQCNGTGDWSLELTTKDRSGAASLYGNPAR